MITLMARHLARPPRPPRTDPHPVEQPGTAARPRPIRIRAQQQPHTIHLAHTALT
ncbi:hypothetical protein Q3V23_33970 [Streptomyces sp. VNUA116]|uniref:hypothetical protein n=1 Tax=Streptomyces sp. VNUA116 TaxID=3062449 RepID=UPI0026768A63|nr:hypothetical protein [Streptomyces sp. VNUA116]WKU48680.1 hypothetical protein Q3V23_33970 [Streptomyces sp. VNUA116]